MGVTSLCSVVVLSFSLVCAYLLYHAFCDIYFHPLSRFPGPKHAAASQLPVAWRSWNGTLHIWLRQLHDTYESDVVRISPHELSFISPAAWRDIYSIRSGHPNFPKDFVGFGGRNSILTANDADHSRMRRLLSHAFSEKALREQEPILKNHIDIFTEGIKRQASATPQGRVNMVDWCQWITFDIIGDLAFGEPFNCLVDAKYTPWVKKLIQSFRALASISVAMRFKFLASFLRLFIFRTQMVKDSQEHARLSKEKVDRRLLKGTSRPDFISYILKHNTDKMGMSQSEIDRQSSVFINAGSQTTATFLSGAVWFILQNPKYVTKMREEIDQVKSDRGEISLRNLGELRYFQAFISECHRMYPGTLGGLPRSSASPGDDADALFIPSGTGVHMNQYAAYRSSRNFKDPDVFIPERWLGDERYRADRRQILQPFAMGPRNCIGKNLAHAEIGLVVNRLILTFDFAVCEETDLQWLEQKAWFGWDKKPLVVSVSTRKE